ncbi:hypothetical protein RFI_07526 [Reticulomyxa filosa]|uniref:Transmembrane protein n=1 Tax=Reticulomyxa filosa TaxID=46433 RepID=X6NUX0_RETFI|nr:hypothetical protein RFI_07526 [Reticulomyxa filosa]|eukprot:ETO29594.1 hypothetical protein RFI_07526 [Reticulomyxa filosa]
MFAFVFFFFTQGNPLLIFSLKSMKDSKCSLLIPRNIWKLLILKKTNPMKNRKNKLIVFSQNNVKWPKKLLLTVDKLIFKEPQQVFFEVLKMWRLLVVSLFWGCTNPLMRESTKTHVKQQTAVPNTQDRTNMLAFFVAHLSQMIKFLSNWKFSIPFLLNQCGSVIYLWSLGSLNISIAVPVCTALTALFTAITALVLGEQLLTKTVIKAMICITIGTILCQWK